MKNISRKKNFPPLGFCFLLWFLFSLESMAQPFSIGIIGTTMPYSFTPDTSATTTQKKPGFRGGIKVEIDFKLQKDLYLTPSVIYLLPGEYKNSLGQTVTTAIQCLGLNLKKVYLEKFSGQLGINYSVWRTAVEGETSGLQESGRFGFQGGVSYTYRNYYIEVLYALFQNSLIVSDTFTIKRHSNGLIFGVGYTIK